jgi:hypothetical protein
MKLQAGLQPFASLKETPVKVDYTTTIAASRKDAGQWVPGSIFTVGYTWPKDQPTPVPSVELDHADCSSYATLLLDDQKRLVIVINRSAVIDFLEGSAYLIARATMTPSGQEFTGEVSSRVDDQNGTPPYGWKGSVARSLTAAHDEAFALVRAVTLWRQENGLG